MINTLPLHLANRVYAHAQAWVPLEKAWLREVREGASTAVCQFNCDGFAPLHNDAEEARPLSGSDGPRSPPVTDDQCPQHH